MCSCEQCTAPLKGLCTAHHQALTPSNVWWSKCRVLGRWQAVETGLEGRLDMQWHPQTAVRGSRGLQGTRRRCLVWQPETLGAPPQHGPRCSAAQRRAGTHQVYNQSSTHPRKRQSSSVSPSSTVISKSRFRPHDSQSGGPLLQVVSKVRPAWSTR